jgi:hypothetical protein
MRVRSRGSSAAIIAVVAIVASLSGALVAATAHPALAARPAPSRATALQRWRTQVSTLGRRFLSTSLPLKGVLAGGVGALLATDPRVHAAVASAAGFGKLMLGVAAAHPAGAVILGTGAAIGGGYLLGRALVRRYGPGGQKGRLARTPSGRGIKQPLKRFPTRRVR